MVPVLWIRDGSSNNNPERPAANCQIKAYESVFAVILAGSPGTFGATLYLPMSGCCSRLLHWQLCQPCLRPLIDLEAWLCVLLFNAVTRGLLQAGSH